MKPIPPTCFLLLASVAFGSSAHAQSRVDTLAPRAPHPHALHQRPAVPADRKPNKDKSPQHKQQHDAERAVHMAAILGLEGQSAERFTTLYGQFLDEMRAARQEHARLKGNKGAGKRSLTEDDIRYNIEQQFALSQATLDIRQKYYAAYQQILAPSQIARLYELEKKGTRWRRKSTRSK